jgi:hypothetical protein
MIYVGAILFILEIIKFLKETIPLFSIALFQKRKPVTEKKIATAICPMRV